MGIDDAGARVALLLYGLKPEQFRGLSITNLYVDAPCWVRPLLATSDGAEEALLADARKLRASGVIPDPLSASASVSGDVLAVPRDALPVLSEAAHASLSAASAKFIGDLAASLTAQSCGLCVSGRTLWLLDGPLFTPNRLAVYGSSSTARAPLDASVVQLIALGLRRLRGDRTTVVVCTTQVDMALRAQSTRHPEDARRSVAASVDTDVYVRRGCALVACARSNVCCAVQRDLGLPCFGAVTPARRPPRPVRRRRARAARSALCARSMRVASRR